MNFPKKSSKKHTPSGRFYRLWPENKSAPSAMALNVSHAGIWL